MKESMRRMDSPEPTRQIQLRDPMSEAGRKLLAMQFERMKGREAGSRTGADIESVHQMRVCIRRMRSLFNLIGRHYKPKTVAKYSRGLRRIARALGRVRDLDVLIVDLEAFSHSLSEDERETLQGLILMLDKRRGRQRDRLNALFDSKFYRRFLRDFERLCNEQGRGAISPSKPEVPHQARHVLPPLLHERFARVRAYDSALPSADDAILHALRVECKGLRYALEFFMPLLGKSARGFLREVKAMQDILGRVSDIAVFRGYARRMDKLSPKQSALIERYVEERNHELTALRNRFDKRWASFNTRARQRMFSDALLVLR